LENSDRNLKEMNFDSAEDVKMCDQRIIGFSSTMKSERDELQAILHKKLYNHFRVERMTEKARRIITEIFNVYENNPNQLPYDVWQRDKEYTEKEKYEIICNYIADMTDRFALNEHKKLFNPYQKV